MGRVAFRHAAERDRAHRAAHLPAAVDQRQPQTEENRASTGFCLLLRHLVLLHYRVVGEARYQERDGGDISGVGEQGGGESVGEGGGQDEGYDQVSTIK